MIKTIQIHNFGKIQDLNIDCSNNKNVFILGQNGSGKTTILQAISLALTGKVAKGITNDAYIGPADKDFLIVLELDDGTKIGRTCKGAKLKLPNGSVFKKVKDVYDHLSFDPALLYNLSYVRQGEIADIFLSGNGKAVVDKLISLIIDSKRISDGNTELTRMVKQYESELSDIDNDIMHNRDLMNSIKYDELISEYSDYSSKLNKLNDLPHLSNSSLNRFEEMHNKLASLKAILRDQKKRYDEAKALVDTLVKPEKTIADLRAQQVQYEAYQRNLTEINSLSEEAERFKSCNVTDLIDEYINIKLPRVGHTEEELKHIKDIKDSIFYYITNEDKISDNEEAIQLMKEYHKLDDIDANELLKLKQRVAYLVKELNPYKEVVMYVRATGLSAKEAIENKLSEIDSKIDSLKALCKDSPSEVTNEEFDRVQKAWSYYESQISIFENIKKSMMPNYSEFKRLSNELSGVPSLEEISNLRNLDHLISMVDLCKKHLDMYNQSKSTIDNLMVKQNEIYDKIKAIQHWKDIFSEVPNRLRQTLFNPVVAVLNKEFYDLFSFSGLGEIKIDWSKVLITVGDKRFEQLSGAQMVAVGLSLRLALLKIMGECVPIMLVDEPTTFLDDDRKNDIAKLLSHMGAASQCFVSTHDDNIIGSNSVVINLNK